MNSRGRGGRGGRGGLGAHLEAVLLAQDAGVDGLDDGLLVQDQVQSLGRAAGGQQRLVGVGLLEALHQAGPGGGGARGTARGGGANRSVM